MNDQLRAPSCRLSSSEILLSSCKEYQQERATRLEAELWKLELQSAVGAAVPGNNNGVVLLDFHGNKGDRYGKRSC